MTPEELGTTTQGEARAEATPKKQGGKHELFRQQKWRTTSVELPDKGEFTVVAVSPKEVAEINKLCIKKVPDAEHPGEEKLDWDATMRPFLLIARALRDADGRRMFPADEAGLLYGAEKVGSDLDNAEVELLLTAVNEVSGLGRSAKAAAKKDS